MMPPFPTVQQTQGEPFVGDYRDAACIQRLPADLTSAYGIQWETVENDGLGTTDVAGFVGPDNRRYILAHHRHSVTLGYPLTKILTLHQTPDESAVVDFALAALDIPKTDVTWLRDDIRLPNYRVLRQDDHGRSFVVHEGQGLTDALRVFRELESHAHKQTYFLEQVPGSD